MTNKELLVTVIESGKKMIQAKNDYDKHPGGGASQKNKNRLWKEYKLAAQQFANVIFNAEQLIK